MGGGETGNKPPWLIVVSNRPIAREGDLNQLGNRDAEVEEVWWVGPWDSRRHRMKSVAGDPASKERGRVVKREEEKQETNLPG